MKAGTTALYFLLKQHPNIFMCPRKEPNFFASQGFNPPFSIEGGAQPCFTLDEYQNLFSAVSNETAIGEASHSYLYFPGTEKKLLIHDPFARIICILRNPVDRAFSHYLYLFRDEKETIKSFEEALLAEDGRILKGVYFGHYIRRGLYYEQVKRYKEVFKENQLQIYLYEDFRKDPLSVAQDAYSFLGVNPEFIPDHSIIRNPAGVPRNKLLHNLLVKPNLIRKTLQPLLPPRLYRFATSIRDRNLTKPTLSIATRENLIGVFRDDILRLQDLIGRDLTRWLT